LGAARALTIVRSVMFLGRSAHRHQRPLAAMQVALLLPHEPDE
jgi:hypothetical protein